MDNPRDGDGAPADGGSAAWTVETVAAGLVVPWDLDFAPDGRIFLTERPGRIRVVEDGALRAEPWAELDVVASAESGLMGIALAPDFASTGHVYVVGTFRDGGLVNRVVRLTDRQGVGTDPRVVVDGLPSHRLHAGAALAFGPDGLLYVTTGDAREPTLARSPDALNGKLLRYRADGTPAGEESFGGPIVAIGLRNPQDIDWDPATGALFASEHGPSGFADEGGRTGHDELNRLAGGNDYGWPEVAGQGGGQRFTAPLAVWTPAIAPSGIAIYDGDAIPQWRGDAFLGALRGRQLRRVDLEGEGGAVSVASQEALLQDDYGRIRAVATGPDGALYFTTSNRDGRGDPAPEDDRLLRIVPAP